MRNLRGPGRVQDVPTTTSKTCACCWPTREHPLAPNIAALLDKPGDLTEAIELLEKEITALDASLLEDAFYQVEFLDRCSAGFFTANRDLIFTLSHGRAVRPALIVQQMICTVRGDESYPGVLYSRNPNTGRKMMVETVRSIFGEDIMTGTVQARVTEFAQRDEIKERFPALFHFVPSLRVLEKEFASTVTAEFASETVRHGHFFALLQINESELTGRAALVSAMDMFNETLLPKQKVPGLVKPFHFRQIMSDTIDEDAFDELDFFADGYSILPRRRHLGPGIFHGGGGTGGQEKWGDLGSASVSSGSRLRTWSPSAPLM